VGNSASDDPEGQKMYDVILKEIDNDPDVYPLVNIENNDKCIGSIMKLAKCFVHVSTKEGFGLVVTEAMWQGTAVIGSKIGGIVKQVIDHNTGFLVEPNDVESITKHMKSLLLNEADRESMEKNGIEHIRHNFLLPVLIKNYIMLMRYYLEIDNKFPTFRMNDITYNEIKQAVYGRSVWPFTTTDLKEKVETLWEDLENLE
jgi:trehalose synthase